VGLSVLEIHLGALRGPDQIAMCSTSSRNRGRPESLTVIAFTGALGGEDALADVLDAITRRPGSRSRCRSKRRTRVTSSKRCAGARSGFATERSSGSCRAIHARNASW